MKRGAAALRDATRKTHTSDNCRWARSIPDAAREERCGSAAEAQRKSESRRVPLEECSFSSGKNIEAPADCRYFAFARFSSTTREVVRTPSFEIERSLFSALIPLSRLRAEYRSKTGSLNGTRHVHS